MARESGGNASCSQGKEPREDEVFQARKNQVLHAGTWKTGKIMAIRQPFHFVRRWSSVTSGRGLLRGWGAAQVWSWLLTQ